MRGHRVRRTQRVVRDVRQPHPAVPGRAERSDRVVDRGTPRVHHPVQVEQRRVVRLAQGPFAALGPRPDRRPAHSHRSSFTRLPRSSPTALTASPAHLRCSNELCRPRGRARPHGSRPDALPGPALRPRTRRQPGRRDVPAVRRGGAARRAAPPGVRRPAQHRAVDPAAGRHARRPQRTGRGDPGPLDRRGRPRPRCRTGPLRL